MRVALLLVDFQEEFLSEPGLRPSRGEVVARAATLLESFREARLPVIHIHTTIRPGRDAVMPHWRHLESPRCVEGSAGHATPSVLRPREQETVVDKTVFSPFVAGDLVAVLRVLAVDTVVLAGVHLHACVRATALDAYQRGFRVIIAEDATASGDPLHGAVSRRWLEDRAISFRSVAGIRDDLSAEETARAPEAERQVVAEATGRATLARGPWQEVPRHDRLEVLERLARLVEADGEALAREMAVDVGKPVREGRAEVEFAAALLRAARRYADVTDPDGARRRPLGVVALVTPWNNPVGIPLGKIGPALLHGNAVVWKPSPPATDLSRRVLDLIGTAGVPQGLVGLIAGGRSTAAALMEDPAVDAVTLTGSEEAGLAGQIVCARRHIPFQAELGGNNAAVVWSDADLSAAARVLAEAGFGSAGQRCTANRRIVIHTPVMESFLASFEDEVRRLVWGDPLEEATQVGPLVSVEARDRVAAVVARAREAGAVVWTPHPEAQRDRLTTAGAYYPPTIVSGVGPDAEIVQEETFGPVVVIQEARDWTKALARLNGVRQGLVAALFTASREREESFLEEARAGVLKLGAGTAGVDPGSPFGGWKASGVGPAEHGASDREFYTRAQCVARGDTVP